MLASIPSARAANRVRPVCDVCDSEGFQLLERYTSRDWPLVACTECGFAYLREVPDYVALAEELAWEKTSAAERERRVRRRMGRLDIATRWRTTLGHWLDRTQIQGALPAAGRVLDIGCGGACRVPEGPTPYGIEISKALASRAAPAFEARGGAVINASAIDGLGQFAGEFFSGIMMRSFLEHESQPRSLLELAFRCLAPGGVVFVRVPNFGGINRRVVGREWCGFRFPDHVNYFTGASLRRLAARAGFGYRRLNWLSPFDDNLIAVLKKSPA